MKLYDSRFKSHSTITIAGPSQSGKTTLVRKIVSMRDELFTEKFSNVLWYCAFPPTKKLDGVTYKIGTPLNAMNEIHAHDLVILDDFMFELSKTDDLTNLMTKAVHHLPMTLIYITQNYFQKGDNKKTQRMNTNYLIIFKNPHDRSQIDLIGRRMFPKDPKFLSSAYTDATSNEAFSYLLIDCQQETPEEIRIRTKITERTPKVYVSNSVPLSI